MLEKPVQIRALLTSSMLLEHVTKFPELEKVTNELVHFKDHTRECSFQTLYLWIKQLYGKSWPEKPPTIQAIARSISRLSARLAKLRKQHSSPEKDSSICEFLQQEFILPSIGLRHGRVQHFSPKRSSKRVVTASSDEKLCKEMKTKMYAITRNANKRLKRREALISEQKECIENQKAMIKSYKRKMKAAESKVEELRAKISRVSHRATYWRGKAEGSSSKKFAKMSELRQEIKELKEKLSFLDHHNSEMSETIESILHSDMISTFEGGKYTDDVRACVYELLSLNVGVSNIAPVIRCVLKSITHKSVARLPSHGLTCQMILESLTVVQAQLGDQLSQAGRFNTLQTDGTTNTMEHMMSALLALVYSTRQTYTLGLRHVFSGSAQDTLDTLKEILDDIDSVHSALGRSAASSKIISSLKNTMSDRHAAENLFNAMLHDYRVEVLPIIAENWNDVAEPQREQFNANE